MAGVRGWIRGVLGEKEQRPPTDAPRSFAGDNDVFALAMYELLRQGRGNVFFSPFSIRTALAMACIGARGKTAEQMAAALRFSPGDETHLAFGEMLQRLNAAGG